MKRIQFLLLIVASVLTAANLTDVDVVTSKFMIEKANVKEIYKAAKESCDLLLPSLPFPRPSDCEEVLLNGNTTSGVYTIWPKRWTLAHKSVQVYCDMTTDGGGWTVLQRRGQYGNAPNYFNRTWEFYKQGFGELEKEFWIGNEVIHALTTQAFYSVRFDMRLVNGTSTCAVYDEFWIKDEDRKYKLHIAGYSGNSEDSMLFHHGMKFSTWDNDNDKHSTHNCAASSTGGWWFSNCFSAHLNGLNMNGKHGWRMSWYAKHLEFSEIKIKPRYFG